MTAGLLIKNYQMHEGRNIAYSIKQVVFLAQKSRHVVEACGRKLGRSPSERDHVWMGAVKKDALLILYITSITQVTSRGGVVSPGHNFNS